MNRSPKCLVGFILAANLIFSACSSTSSTAEIETAVAATIAANQPTSTFTGTSAPSRTPRPTRTPAPTSTPRPTRTPTVPPTATPIPEPIHLEGSGDDIRDVELSYPIYVAHIQYGGRSNFIVQTFNDKGEMQNTIINTIGIYDGVVPFNFYWGELYDVTRVQVESSGDWVFDILPLTKETLTECWVGETCQGTGDDVISVLGGEPDIAHIVSDGDSNFVILAYSDGDVDLLVNEIGTYDGRIILNRGVYMLVVECEGNWTIQITGK